ncbi:hypothetical protein DPMN_100124 [Dreissena polymorpha]|uniref:Uncharacterized protein n=1 Tax=Dreissena polymorpha TaxID=45954 RepID=A0A9D4LG71_DREPO|nr:hypothetical protein DPMN_100124 [Dreissena polymorpha]
MVTKTTYAMWPFFWFVENHLAQYITIASNNSLTSLFHYTHIRKLPYPTAAMFSKGQGSFSNNAGISFEKKVLCNSHNDCAKHQTSRVSQGLTIPMLQQLLPPSRRQQCF